MSGADRASDTPRPAAAVPDAELLKRVRRLSLRVRGRVNSRLAGAYRSAFRGQGMEFDEVRRYTPGDDARAIDWNVTARSDEPHVKRFREERDSVVWLACDVSGSIDFGTRQPDKRAVLLEAAAVFAFAAAAARDRVGLVTFDRAVRRAVAPAGGTRHASRLLRELAASEPVAAGATDPAPALTRILRTTRHRAAVVLLSDFLMAPEATAGPLERLALRHDVVPVVVRDPVEASLPAGGLCLVRDAETGRRGWVDLGSRRVRRLYRQRQDAAAEAWAALFRRLKLTPLTIETGGDVLNQVAAYLRRREARA